MKKIILTIITVSCLLSCETDELVGPDNFSLPELYFSYKNSQGQNLLDTTTENSYTDISYFLPNATDSFWSINTAELDYTLNHLKFTDGAFVNVSDTATDVSCQIQLSTDLPRDNVRIRIITKENRYFLQTVWYNDVKIYEKEGILDSSPTYIDIAK